MHLSVTIVPNKGLSWAQWRRQELQEAIRRQLRALLQELGRPVDEKRFEEALVARLTRDTAEDAAYLLLRQSMALQERLQQRQLSCSWAVAGASALFLAIALGAAEYAYRHQDGPSCKRLWRCATGWPQQLGII